MTECEGPWRTFLLDGVAGSVICIEIMHQHVPVLRRYALQLHLSPQATCCKLDSTKSSRHEGKENRLNTLSQPSATRLPIQSWSSPQAVQNNINSQTQPLRTGSRNLCLHPSSLACRSLHDPAEPTNSASTTMQPDQHRKRCNSS